MSKPSRLYIAGTGAITAIGGNAAMTAAAVEAGISGYSNSRFTTQALQHIPMALLPHELFDDMEADIDEGDRYCGQYDRIIKLSILAIREACDQPAVSRLKKQASIPLMLAMQDAAPDVGNISPALLLSNLVLNCSPWVNANQVRTFQSGRAAGIDAINAAFDFGFNSENCFILVGGSDSYYSNPRLTMLENSARLLLPGAQDGFVPGEGAGYLLLTPYPALALERNGQVVALHKPGIADEAGHLHSEATYHGDGLDQAFKLALANCPQHTIERIYSSMNGEHYWARELGVAQMRNRDWLRDDVAIEHPADCFGDLGSATAAVLIAMSAENLIKSDNAYTHLAYCSSDAAKRGAVVVEKRRL